MGFKRQDTPCNLCSVAVCESGLVGESGEGVRFLTAKEFNAIPKDDRPVNTFNFCPWCGVDLQKTGVI